MTYFKNHKVFADIRNEKSGTTLIPDVIENSGMKKQGIIYVSGVFRKSFKPFISHFPY
jgi:hypothetical protein